MRVIDGANEGARTGKEEPDVEMDEAIDMDQKRQNFQGLSLDDGHNDEPRRLLIEMDPPRSLFTKQSVIGASNSLIGQDHLGAPSDIPASEKLLSQQQMLKLQQPNVAVFGDADDAEGPIDAVSAQKAVQL